MKRCPKCELNWIQDDEELCAVCEPHISDQKANAISFFDLGLKCGDYLVFTKAPQYKAKIIGARTLLFEDKEYTHTKLGVLLLKRIGNPKAEQLGSGLGVFRLDEQDKNLVYRYFRLHNKDE